MKKALSLALALVMVFTLAPMTANAAQTATPTGSGTAEDPYVLVTDETTYKVTLEANATAFVSTGEAYNATINGVGSAGGYSFSRGKNDYNPVISVDGIATITLEESNMVILHNLEEEANTVYLNATAGEGGAPVGTWNSPEIVEFEENEYRPGVFAANLQKELEAGNQGYYYQITATADGAISVSVDAAADLDDYAPMGWMYQVTNTNTSVQTDMHYSDDEEVVYTEYISVSEGDVLDVFVSTYDPNSPWDAPAGVVFVNLAPLAVGSSEYPEEVVAGTYTATVEAGSQGYYYIYKATEAGKLSVTIDTANSANGWNYSLYNLTSWAMTESHTSGDDEIIATDGINVAAGDEVQITIATFDPTNPWETPAGTVDWSLSFEAGVVEDDELGGGSDDEDDELEEKEPFYQDQQTELVLGGQYIILDLGYETTLFEFQPESTGTYTFTLDAEDAVIGYYGSNIWFPYHDGAEMTNTLTVNYPELGGPIVIGVSNSAMALLTIERTGDAQEVEKTPEYIYEATADKYVFTGNADNLTWVDIEDATEDKAVLGEDGYYHLNTVDGPILFINLFDEILPLANATETGKIAIAVYGEDGELEYIWNCNDAIDLYAANVDEATKLYPLTEELIYIYQTYGEQQLWYTETGFVGGQFALGNPADAWMFTCMYDPDLTDASAVVPPVDDEPEKEETPVVPEIPDTGDAANFALWIAVLGLGVVAIASSVAMKKREF